MEVACKVVLPCTLGPKFTLWNMFICNSNLGVRVTSSYFLSSLYLHDSMHDDPLDTERQVNVLWNQNDYTDTHPILSTLPHVAASANMSRFVSLRKDHGNIGMLLLETNAITNSYSIFLKCMCVQSHMHILCILCHVRAVQKNHYNSSRIVSSPLLEDESFQY